jgi:hypothetical protein
MGLTVALHASLRASTTCSALLTDFSAIADLAHFSHQALTQFPRSIGYG